ncbi:hypothetical protein EV421DRAFT_1741802 [Armillaria borealis]|uniref:Uncharacterized protein n=1 Tax=Armillaria borealis TaxID=47425 RepID=A0AA39MGK5_9AGAR|nr:hypothetical protein EV421DRAFT_1741802 [Armillaria borealis]
MSIRDATDYGDLNVPVETEQRIMTEYYERAFSSAGLTLGKLRSWLKGDIVEALQCLKCLYRKDLIFREVVAFDGEEVEMEDDQGPSPPPTIATVSWDEMLIDVNYLADSDVEIDV